MLRLTRIKRQNDLRQYCFEEYSRPDYLARAIVISVDPHFFIRAIRCNSALYGIVAISYGRGVTESSGWEDEAAARGLSGTANYYSVAGAVQQPALLDKVLADTLASVRNDTLRQVVRFFAEHSDQNIAYPYRLFTLEPIQTTGQIHILKYVKAVKADETMRFSLRALLLNLNPVYVTGRSYQSIVSSLERIHYTCNACGAENSVLLRNCVSCLEHRPPIKWYAIALFCLRALVDMSYLAYVLLTIGFLIFTLFHLKANG